MADALFALRFQGNLPIIYRLSPGGTVINSFAGPAPVVTPGFQGLADAGGSLFYLDGSVNGAKTLYELDPNSGAVIDSDVLPATSQVGGLAYLGGLVYVQVDPTNQVQVFDPVADTVVRTFTVAADIAGGLTGAGDRGLLYANNVNGAIFAIDPGTGAVVRTLVNPSLGPLLGGLAYFNRELFAAGFGTQIFRVNPDTGLLLGTIFPVGSGPIGGLGGDGADVVLRITLAPAQTVTGRDFGNRQNSAPVAVNDTAMAGEDAVLNVQAPGVLANDTDADPSDSKMVVAVNGSAAAVGQSIALPSGALLTLRADGSYAYNPNGKFNALRAGQTATDSFTYTMRDGMGATSTATVTVTVNGANDGPTAAPDRFTTDEDTPVSGNVLANDTDPDQGDTKTVASVNGSAASVGQTITLASGARLNVNADGTFTYDPTGAFDQLRAGQTATDSFAYVMADGAGATGGATVTVTVAGVNDAPVAVDDEASTDEDTALNAAAPGVLGNDTDRDAGDTKTVTAVNGSGPAVGAEITLPSGEPADAPRRRAATRTTPAGRLIFCGTARRRRTPSPTS